MTTFLDTSAIMSAINHGETHHDWSVAKIAERREEGPLVIADIVYSELAAGMKSREETDAAITEWALERLRSSDDALFKAGQAYKAYRQKKAGTRRSGQDQCSAGFSNRCISRSRRRSVGNNQSR